MPDATPPDGNPQVSSHEAQSPSSVSYASNAEPVQLPFGRPEVRATIGHLQQEIHAANTRITNLFPQIEPFILTFAEETRHEIYNALSSGNALSIHFPQEQQKMLEELQDAYRVKRNLHEQAAPLMRQQLLDEVAGIVGHTRMGIFPDELLGGIVYARALQLQLKNGEPEFSYKDLERAQHYIDHLYTQLEEYHALDPNIQPIHTQNAAEIRQQVLNHLYSLLRDNQGNTKFQQYAELSHTYKVGLLDNPFDIYNALENLTHNFSFLAQSDSPSPSVESDTLFLQRLDEYIAFQAARIDTSGIFSEIRDHIAEGDAFDPKTISITGLERKGYGVVITKENVDSFLSQFPRAFLKRLDGITWLSQHQVTDTQFLANSLETTGAYIVEWDREKFVRKIQVSKTIFVDNPHDKNAIVTTQEAFLAGLAHELGHHIHSEGVTIDELIKWQSIISQQLPSGVSPYHAFVREYEKQHPETAYDINGAKEEFAECISLFITKPALLHKISPQRYAYMLDLFTSRAKDPDKARQAYEAKRLQTNAATLEHQWQEHWQDSAYSSLTVE